MEQLKQMYKRGMEMGDDTEEEAEEVDQLLQWTQTLDEQVLNTPSDTR